MLLVKKPRLVIATRGSALALWQANWVKSRLTEAHSLEAEIRVIKTTGDKQPELLLTRSGTKGLFIKEIEEALLAGEAHLAVHSLKDLPNDQPEGLKPAAYLEREDPRDVLIAPEGKRFADLAPGSRVGTSSLRRQVQLRRLRPELEFEDIRGNLDTRIRKLERGDYDAVVVAAAGVHRLGLKERITEYFPPEAVCPAVGQGVVAVEIRSADDETAKLVRALDHGPTRTTTEAERIFLRRLGGGCRIPIAAHGTLTKNGTLHLRGIVADPEGKRLLRAEIEGEPDTPEQAGISLAEKLLAQGAEELIRQFSE